MVERRAEERFKSFTDLRVEPRPQISDIERVSDEILDFGLENEDDREQDDERLVDATEDSERVLSPESARSDVRDEREEDAAQPIGECAALPEPIRCCLTVRCGIFDRFPGKYLTIFWSSRWSPGVNGTNGR